MWWSRATVPRRPTWDLSTPILWFSETDAWTIGHACQGAQIWGGTGSGKSTGSLAAIVLAFLRAGFGGLFLTSKPEDRRTYERYCRLTGRLGDLMIFGPEQPLRYNALDAELRRRDAGAGLTENIVTLLGTLLEVSDAIPDNAKVKIRATGNAPDRQLLRNAVELLVMAKDRLSVPELYKLVVSAPVSFEQVGSESWRKGSFCFRCLEEADARGKTERQLRRP